MEIPPMKIIGIGLAVLLVSAALTPVTAQLTPDEGTHKGIQFACAGFGKEERSDPRWNAYPLKLVFATGSGGYFADTIVTIQNEKGARLVENLHCDAPWLLLKLGPGKYKVTATSPTYDVTSEADIKIRPNHNEKFVIRFPAVRD